MRLHFKFQHQAGLVIATFLLLMDAFLLTKTIWFFPVLVIAAAVATASWWLDFIAEARKQSELEAQFPEFVRNFVSAVKSGIPAAKAVAHVSDADYGILSTYIKKLANQLEWAIPFHKAFIRMADETGNKLIQRSVLAVVEAEQYGGNIEDVLNSITESLIQIKKIRAQRESSIHSQVVQNYIIFLIFLGVLVIIQNLLVPYIIGMGVNELGMPIISTDRIASAPVKVSVRIDFSSPALFLTTLGQWFLSLRGIFLMLAIIQSVFAGLVIGKLAEANFRAGVKHSLILLGISVFIIILSQSALK